MIVFQKLKNLDTCSCAFDIDQGPNEEPFDFMSKIVNVSIKSQKQPDGKICLFSQPGDVIVQREKEMKHIASIKDPNWTSSLIMSKIIQTLGGTNKCNDVTRLQLSSYQMDEESFQNKEISIILEPELDPYFSRIIWSQSLMESIQCFYSTGVIPFFDNCSARDNLLALEYLRVMYTPKQIKFETFGTYLHFKFWSDYMIYRKDLSNWVKYKLTYHHSKHCYMFVSHPESAPDASLYISGKQCEHFDGGLNLGSIGKGKEAKKPKSCTVVHDMFSGDNPGYSKQVREDFMIYLQKELPGTSVSFTLQKVTYQTPQDQKDNFKSQHTIRSPVLIIALKGDYIYTKGQLPCGKYHDPANNSILFEGRSPNIQCDIHHMSQLEISAITDDSRTQSLTLTDDSNSQSQKSDKLKSPLMSEGNVDTMNAEWLLNVFFCNSKADYFDYDV